MVGFEIRLMMRGTNDRQSTGGSGQEFLQSPKSQTASRKVQPFSWGKPMALQSIS